MGKKILKTMQDCEDLLEGNLWMGTGGGGSYEEGYNTFKKVLDDGLVPEWVDPKDIPDDVWTATIGLHGTIAPVSEDTLLEIKNNGLVESSEWYPLTALKELGENLGHNYQCVVPAELGPDSVALPLAVGAYLGIAVVDGDYIGRAVPEEAQSTYCLHEKQSNLFAGVDKWGNRIFVKDTFNTHCLERIAKMLAVAAYGDIAVATTPLIAKEMKKILVNGTLSKCLKIGQILRSSREIGEDPVEAVLNSINGWRLFEGSVITLETEDRGGYLYGNVKIEGSGDFRNQILDVWFKNENHVTWMNGKPWICSPDLVSLVSRDNGRGIYNAELREGDEITAVGMKGVEGFRTEHGLSLAGPKHFGFEIDYRPIEELISPLD